MKLSLKAKQIEPSLTLAITAKAKKMKSEGIDVIGFGAGEPDFDTPENIQNAAIEAMKKGLTRYTPASGIIELKNVIVGKFKKDNNLSYDSSQIIISTGAKQCLANVFQAILNPCDEVIVSTPYWVSYPELIRLADGVPVYVNSGKGNNFKYTLESLKGAVTSKTKAIIINSPNNPTGTLYSKEELVFIANFCKENDIIIISDEIYEKLIYGDKKHISIASVSEDAYNRTIVINGVSKSYAMTGWRIGYAAGPKEIIKLMSNIQSHTTSNPNSIAQYAAVEAISGNQDTMDFMVKEFSNRKDYMVNRIEKIKGISAINPDGAFYVMINIEDLLNKKINNEVIKDSLDFSRLLLEQERVAVIPGDAFGVSNYIRLSYATSLDNINKGLDRIETFIAKII
ncbi:pyridoxal phosphate-dependent aminotransferase [Clostridium algidicarnis]|uniref:Aminotransferase n=2 Tax=Clostridium algidicarnis TaxID=37659 RepID=A0A2S6FXX0_9CLOT|nr:pyridoxal phosphate-dependent aminotransferase [Clostridium algidicarnis]MBB6630177.1 pyridoxal phosphate-dependent aminotransferase [Clostridium algidicarnis]MBB6697515.1 pyridoxal phosphate-dependent aminotransferase [Clostridium algidicarnis]MBU3193002.1 pyridoxal phosphate-dependent aminotransferase [Clostridium algidicarnis]MBU3203396.1 pyridoxal phosphate-dependent aminotransferase [Clostridium algidicarnis]MBU3206281.1 pyridoxal phosphate-dependent aminotransferase [Clostridium algid